MLHYICMCTLFIMSCGIVLYYIICYFIYYVHIFYLPVDLSIFFNQLIQWQLIHLHHIHVAQETWDLFHALASPEVED